MPKIPCKLCGSCGRYHDITLMVCPCGADLSKTPAAAVEMETAFAMRGNLTEGMPVYVQKCSACGTESFTADPAKRVKICYACHKARVATVTPTLYVSIDKVEEPEEEERNAPPVMEATVEKTPESQSDDAAQWRGILGGVQNAVSASPQDEDDDDDDAPGWGSLLGGTAQASVPAAVQKSIPVPAAAPASAPAPAPKNQEITLTALRYGRYAFTLKAGDRELPLLMGRYAAHGDFLQQDIRVSGEHCKIEYRNGEWWVVDNHSTNGTAVNGRFLDINGEHILRSGDELMLGHHADSMAFRVSIR